MDGIPEGDTTCASAQIVAPIDKASAYEREAREKNYSPQQILEMRQEKVKPLLEKVYAIIDTLNPAKKSALGEADTYAKNQKDKLMFLLIVPKSK